MGSLMEARLLIVLAVKARGDWEILFSEAIPS